jgi:hypothetical protein
MRQSENCELAECVIHRWPKKCFREEKEEREGRNLCQVTESKVQNTHASLAFLRELSLSQQRDGNPKLVTCDVVHPPNSTFALQMITTWHQIHFGRDK